MRIAIVESGGKQYRAIEGSTIDVDRLAFEVGKKFDFERVLLMADEDIVMVGTPTVGEIVVSATVVDHVKGPKVTSFKYRPKKRIRVKGGHRHFYTRLMIDFIGKAGEVRKAKVEKEVVVVADAPAEAAEEPKVEKQKKASSKETAAKKPAATKAAPKSSTTTKKTVSKKTDKK